MGDPECGNHPLHRGCWTLVWRCGISPCISSPNRVCVCVSVCPCVCVGIQHWRWASRVANLPEHCWVRRKKVHTREKNWCLVFTNFPYFHDKYSYYFYCSQPLIFSARAVNLSRPRELFHGTLLFSSFIPFLRQIGRNECVVDPCCSSFSCMP